MKQTRPSASAAPLLFVHAELRQLEAERARLAGVLRRMRKEHRHGAILKTEFRLQQITGRILATALGKTLS